MHESVIKLMFVVCLAGPTKPSLILLCSGDVWALCDGWVCNMVSILFLVSFFFQCISMSNLCSSIDLLLVETMACILMNRDYYCTKTLFWPYLCAICLSACVFHFISFVLFHSSLLSSSLHQSAFITTALLFLLFRSSICVALASMWI